MAIYKIRQVVEYGWTVEAESPLEAAQIAMDQGYNHSDRGIPNGKAGDLTVTDWGGAKLWKYSSGDMTNSLYVFPEAVR